MVQHTPKSLKSRNSIETRVMNAMKAKNTYRQNTHINKTAKKKINNVSRI